MSALIQNFDTVEKAIETSANSAGSALKENERYLDSIQGKIDQFNNATQSLWSNLLDADWVKRIVEWGTKIIQSLDTIQGKFLAIVKVVAILMAYKKVNPLDWVQSIGSFFAGFSGKGFKGFVALIWEYAKALIGVAPAMKTMTAETMANTMATALNDDAKTKAALSSLGFASSTEMLTMAQRKQAIETLIANQATNGLTNAQIAAIAASWGLKTSIDATNGSIKVLDVTTKSFMATNPVGWILAIVSVVVTLITVIGSLTNTTKRAAEATKEALSAYESAQDTLKTHKQTIETIRKDYEKLADGVDELGNNIGLTSEEYERYNEIVNQVAEMFPNMVSGYTSEGNAIIALKGNVEELTKAYEAEAQAARDAIILSQDDIWDNYLTNVKTGTGILNNKSSLITVKRDLEALFEYIEIGSEELVEGYTRNHNTTFYPIVGKNAASYETVIEELPKLQAAYRDTVSQLNAESAKIKPIIDAYLLQDYDYIKLSDVSKSAVRSIVNRFDAEFYSQFDSAIDMQAWITTNLVKPLQDVDASANFEAAFDLQTKFNKGEVPVKEYEEMVQGIIGLIEGLGLDNADSIIKSIKLVFDVDDSGSVDSNIQEVAKKLLNESDYDKIKTLTKSDLDIINQNATEWSQNAKWNGSEWEIGEPILMSWDQLIEKIENAKSVVEEVKASDSLESLATIKDKLSGLGGAFDEFVEDGKVSIDTLSDLNEKFGSIDGFEDFINVLGNSASTTEQVEQAISDMASAYLATTDILSNVTDANRDFVVSQLKALGVTNPEEYLNNLQSVHQAMAEEYGVDLSNYGTVEQMKQAISSDLHGILVGLEGMTIQELASKYGNDLLNYSNLEEAKTEAARREALKRQEILKNETIAAKKQDIIGQRDSQTVGKDEIKTGWWIFGKNKYEGKSYSEMEALANDGDAKAKEWVNNVKSTYDNMVTESTNSAESAYAEAVSNINNAIKQFNSIDDYVAQYNLKLKVDVPSLGDDDYGKGVADDAFQKEMDYWENRLSANQARADRLQGQIDLLEQKGMKASADYYRNQMTLLNSVDPDDGVDSKLELLQGKLAAVTKRLGDVTYASEEWWEAAHEYNDIVNEIQEIESAIVDMQDAIAEIDTYKFEEFNTRVSNLADQLETIRNLLADEDEWFNDEGEWTEDGVATLATYIQELEIYKSALSDTAEELEKYQASYAGNEKYYETLGIHSEQEYYDKFTEIQGQYSEYLEMIDDTEDAVVDMYESQIDAIEEYMDTLIDGYNDYIDSVKEALDVERDLYDFKKNVQKQAKDIAKLERRIASLSGSTNASDIAERRKLEAELYESRESLNETYYDHATNAQSEALDAERTAYEDTINRFVRGLRTSLDEATANMDEFLMGVTSMVMYNADTVLQKYQETNLPLTTELTNPWIKAKEAVGNYSGDALDLMNQWTKEGGFFTQFNTTGTTNLESPWKAGTTAATSFQTSVEGVMTGVVSNISTNVKTASEELSKLYQQITDTKKHADELGGGGGGGGGGGNTVPTPINKELPPVAPKNYRANATLKVGTKTLSASGTGSTEAEAKKNAESNMSTAYYNYQRSQGSNDDAIYTLWTRQKSKIEYNIAQAVAYAKGTTGTPRDEWAITDEPWFGDELVLVPTAQGNLSYMRKGTGVVPADLTANLMEWGQFTPDSLNLGGGVNVNMINNAVNKPEFNFTFDALVKAENITEETLPAVKKLVTQELNRFTKELNYALKGKGAR